MFVILSGKYLTSANCMYELYEVWRNCRMNFEEFRQRIRVYRQPDAKMMTPAERLRCAKYWDRQFTKLTTLLREDPALMGTMDFTRYRLMKEFACHVGDMLALIADTLLPRDFEEFERYGFSDQAPQS